jgi:KDO2-lipid IV(A) lauroyltransferase
MIRSEWRYYAFKLAGLTLSHLPKQIGYLIAYIVADTVYLLSSRQRAVIADNIEHVLGSEVDKSTLKKTVRAVLRNAAKNYFDLIKIPHLKLDDIERSITTHGWHHLEEALSKGKGVMLVTAHLGSFDMAAQIFAIHSVKTTILVESLEPAPLLDHVTTLRESNGLTCIPSKPGVLEVLIQTLRRGEAVLFACDRDIANNGIRSDFFGEETTLPANAVLIAMRTGASVVPIFNLRREDGRYDIYVEPAIDIIPAGNGSVARNIERIASVMEKYIKTCPEQWVVLSPIWAGKQWTALLSIP